MKLLIALCLVFMATFAYAEYTEEVVVDKIEILKNGIVQVRYATIVYKDGTEITKTYLREIIEPDEDIEEIEDAKVKSVAEVIFTEDVKKKYKKEKEK